jgi:DNA-binding MarR family transcriptional regulator
MPTEQSRDLAHLLSRAERLLAGHLSAMLATENCTLEEWRVLQVLGDGHGHVMSEIADSALLPETALTKLMDQMVSDGLVYRHATERDRHRVLAYLSLHGRDMYEGAADVIAAAEQQVAADLGDNGELSRRLTRLIDVLASLALLSADTPASALDRGGTEGSQGDRSGEWKLVFYRLSDDGDGGIGPFGDGSPKVGEFRLGDVQAAGRHDRAKLDEDGAEVHLDREQVAGPAAGHDRDRHHAGQPVRAVPVKEGLEQARVGRLVGR